MITEILHPIFSLLDKIIPDPKAREEAKLKLLAAEGQQALQEIQAQMSAIIAEAESPDPWTSRARPSFLYIIYTVILLCVFGGVVGIWYPAEMQRAAVNMNALLKAVPEELWTLFGIGYLGYTGARSLEKVRKGSA
jgi:Holin of 3TMs, for gene-transfer release